MLQKKTFTTDISPTTWTPLGMRDCALAFNTSTVERTASLGDVLRPKFCVRIKGRCGPARGKNVRRMCVEYLRAEGKGGEKNTITVLQRLGFC